MDSDGHPIPNLPGSTVFPNYEPTQADLQFQNEVDQGYVGLSKAEITYLEQSPLEKLLELQDKPWYENTYDYLADDSGMNKGDINESI